MICRRCFRERASELGFLKVRFLFRRGNEFRCLVLLFASRSSVRDVVVTLRSFVCGPPYSSTKAVDRFIPMVRCLVFAGRSIASSLKQ